MSETATMKPKTKDAPFDPWDNPAEYLRSRGWRPTGHPQAPGTCWLDPTKPEETEERKVPLYRTDAEGKRQPVLVVDGDGRNVHAHQVHVFPARYPMPLVEAMAVQQRRDKEAGQ